MSQQANQKDTLFLIGCYNNREELCYTPPGQNGTGVYAYKLSAKTGELTLLTTNEVTPNPAFLIKHPNQDIVYIAMEKRQGDIKSAKIDRKTGKLDITNTQCVIGGATCHIKLSKNAKFIIAANYWEGIVVSSKINEEKNFQAEGISDFKMHEQTSYALINKVKDEDHNKDRQTWPHAHAVVFEPYNNDYMFIPDLGMDQIQHYFFDENSGKMIPTGTCQLEKGIGPRHMVFHPILKIAYVLNELQSFVYVLEYRPNNFQSSRYLEKSINDESSVLFQQQKVSTLLEEDQKKENWSSEIRLHPTNKFLYTAGRGVDKISVFKVEDNGNLQLIQSISTGGNHPRNFAFDITGAFLLVGNVFSDNCTLFNIDLDTGKLTSNKQIKVPSPTYFLPIEYQGDDSEQK